MCASNLADGGYDAPALRKAIKTEPSYLNETIIDLFLQQVKKIHCIILKIAFAFSNA